MKYYQKPIIILLLMFVMISVCYAASDWNRSATVMIGRCDPQCDIESPGKSLFMFGGSYEFWYKDIVSIGPYVYFSQLHSGPIDETNWVDDDISTRNFRSYIAGLDIKARFRPDWDWINVRMPGYFISRIAPYVNAGVGAITFDPTRRSSYHTKLPGDYKRHAGCAPVLGAGFTLFSKMGVTGDIGIDYHVINTDYMDGVKANDDKDKFWTGYIGLTIGSSKPVAPPVIILPEPEPEIEFEPALIVTPPVQNVPYQNGATVFNVTSNINWIVSENVDWFTVAPMVGTNNDKLDVIYQANPEITQRSGQISVSGSGITRTVMVVQAPKPKIEFTREFNLVIEGVQFKTDSAELTSGAVLILDEVVTALNDFPEVTLEIQGHTDSDASDAYNMGLSQRRANSVRKYLIDHGIAAERLTTSWFGERMPIAPNTTPAGKAKNRRIEFKRTD